MFYVEETQVFYHGNDAAVKCQMDQAMEGAVISTRKRWSWTICGDRDLAGLEKLVKEKKAKKFETLMGLLVYLGLA